ncbi:MAG: hypothetical protein AB7G68_11825 [Nitrospiraceae bacterium]
MDETTGRCISCGFLSKFDLHYSGPPPYVYEMPQRDREYGQTSAIRLEAAREIQGFPQCYVNVSNLWGEINKATRAEGLDAFTASRQAFSKDRRCPKWHRYTPGFSPQEHLEEIRMTELEQKRQEFELKLFEMNRSLNDKADASNWRVTKWLMFFAFLEVLFGAAQLAYPDGWPWLMRLLGSPPAPPVPIYPPM